MVLAILLSRAFAAHGQVRKTPAGKTRTYYVAADDVDWDYTPRGRNLIGSPIPEGPEDESGATAHKKFLKAVYHEYTDNTFKSLKPRPQQWEHLGILGPLIRAEVGDIVRIVFKNNSKIFCSMHPHGLAYGKDSEGALYNDGSSQGDKKGDAVPPGSGYIYTWLVPERAGPGPGDGSSVLWMYHSHFVEPRDMNTGLLGPIIVTARGSAKADGAPKDVDREFVTAFAVFDETESWYFESNAMHKRKYLPDLKVRDPLFREHFLAYSINGLVEGNLPMLAMKTGERVRWYLLANSNEDDIHTPHWHGQTVLINNMRTDIASLEPMTMAVADMVPDRVGRWLFHCHVNEHLKGGMQAFFDVTP